MKEKLFIGTSGFYYDHWKKLFYPKDLPKTDYLSFYVKHFNSVEINSSFYRLPSIKTLNTWLKKTPNDFIFSFKASRYITHVKKLKDPKKSIKKFINRIDHIKKKLGVILFQLPKSFNLNIERFEKFISYLPKGYKFAFEFRNRSWINNEIIMLLKKHKLGFCIYDFEGFFTKSIITTDFVYIRMHGLKTAYAGSYSLHKLKKLKNEINSFKKRNLKIYIYFNNDENAYAIKNALSLKKI